ncbi:putative xyloglucan endotransglucosylase/hydrolase protein 26 [Bienertia sinuspersici]
MGNLRAILIASFASTIALQICSIQATFSDSTEFYWGADRGRYVGSDGVELMLNKSGGTGIRSTISYMYGSITMGIKLPSGNSAGTVTTFYLSSTGDKHDEIDFEFLGNVTGEPYTIHTNIYTQGFGQREQQFKPWFDPSDGYHYYTIFWNFYEVVNYNDSEINYPDSQPMKAYSSFWNADDWATQGGRVKTNWTLAPFTAYLQTYWTEACYCSDESCVERCSDKNPENWWTDPKWLVDDVPIRVFRNYHDSEINYPDAQPMQAYSSFWNADDWATQGGRVKTDWDLAPFTASLQNYKVDACYCSDHSCVGRCSAKTYDNWWTNQKFYKLDEEKNQQMKDIQYNYMIYNYCTDYARFNGSYPKECSLPQY